MARHVNIDPGHGGKDPGACSAGERESMVALKSATSLGHELRALGIETSQTRTDDTFVAVMDRADCVDRGELFVSIHMNSSSSAKPNGLSVWYHGDNAHGKRLAEHIFHAVYSLGFLGKYSTGVISDHSEYAGGFGVLREATQRGAAGAVLIEFGFIPNQHDRTAMEDEHKRNLMMQATAAAIKDFFEEIGK